MNRPAANFRSALAPLHARWGQLAPREKTLIAGALAIIALAVLWQLVLAPSLRTFNTATAQGQLLDTQLQRMQTMQTQALALQKQSPLPHDDALRALQQATQQTLGTTAQVSVVADRANITLQAASADALAQWLAQVRVNARSIPLEAHLTRVAAGTGVAWSGTLAMSLPQRP